MIELTSVSHPILMPARRSHIGQKSVPLIHRPADSTMPVRHQMRSDVMPCIA